MRSTNPLKIILSDIDLFSRLVIDMPLYGYQLRPLRPIIDSVLAGQGGEYLLVFPRQSGKNEAVAHLLVYLLNLLQRRGGNIVYGATGDGLGRGIQRLERRLDNRLNRSQWRKAARPARRSLGRAAVVFLSTHPAAAARGETAHWLLVIDEMQDQDATHLEAVFEPMRAANNATALYIGTVKTSHDALWRKKVALEENEGMGATQQVYVVSPDEVTADNTSYGHFLANKVSRLGRSHPVVASEYFNEPIDADGGLFDRRRLALMKGSHARLSPDLATESTSKRVATLDVGGIDEGATNPLARLANPGRDYSVGHVFEIELTGEHDRPRYRAIDVFADQGSRHFESWPGQPGLAERLMAWLNAWQIAHLVVDQSGVGAGLADWMAARLGRRKVTGFTFSPTAKADLGARFLTLVETGRFRYWAGEEEPLSDAWWFFQQARHCNYSLPADGRFETALRWGVPPSARIDTPSGRQPVHDDRLISAALVAVYDDLVTKGALRLGKASSAIVRPDDPIDPDNLRF
ncbi:MAG: hypothetical protein JSW55_03045 [Chloroflexota bacterium]|nr:MAG: hypothetical protein JSW55_03045 [Chloroflexota bacterium]